MGGIFVGTAWPSSVLQRRASSRVKGRTLESACSYQPDAEGRLELLADFRYSLRTLGRAPGFVAIATVTLALAIGVNSAIISLVNGLILRPIVPKRPAEVVSVFTARKEANRDYRQFSYSEFTALGEARERLF